MQNGGANKCCKLQVTNDCVTGTRKKMLRFDASDIAYYDDGLGFQGWWRFDQMRKYEMVQGEYWPAGLLGSLINCRNKHARGRHVC